MNPKLPNNSISDQGAENPKLGNRAPQRQNPPPPSSGVTGAGSAEWDYFRDTAPGAQAAALQTQPDPAITPARVTMSVRMRWNPIRGLDPERLVSWLDQWKLGFFRQAGMAWEMMEKRDYQLQIVAPKRKKAVARHGYQILTREIPEAGSEETLRSNGSTAQAANTAPAKAGTPSPENDLAALAQEQVAFLKDFYNRISVTTALEPDEQGGFSLLVRQMMDAIGKRYAVHEIVWDPDGAGRLTARFIACPIWWFEGTRGKLRFLDSEFQVYGRDMFPGDWLVTVHDGIMEACSIVYLFKSLPLKSWLALIDRFGQPGIHGKTDAPFNSKEWNDFVQVVQDFAEEWSAVSNRNAEISLVEAKTSAGGENMFSAIIEKMDKAITVLWRGADLGTSSKHNATGASLQEDETEILETDDARIAEETLDKQVTRHALAWKFGADAPALAYLKIRVPEERNIANDIAVDQLLTGLGGELDEQETYERYGRQVPKPGAKTLKSAPSPVSSLEFHPSANAVPPKGGTPSPESAD